MKRFHVVLVVLFVFLLLASACAKHAEVSVSGRQDISVEYRNN